MKELKRVNAKLPSNEHWSQNDDGCYLGSFGPQTFSPVALTWMSTGWGDGKTWQIRVACFGWLCCFGEKKTKTNSHWVADYLIKGPRAINSIAVELVFWTPQPCLTNSIEAIGKNVHWLARWPLFRYFVCVCVCSLHCINCMPKTNTTQRSVTQQVNANVCSNTNQISCRWQEVLLGCVQ